MFKTLNTYPNNVVHNWSEEVQGICHDDKYWYFATSPYFGALRIPSKLIRIPVTQDLSKNIGSDIKCVDGPGNRIEGYAHYGDCDYWNGYIFIAVSDDGDPNIRVYEASTMKYVTKCVLKKKNNKEFSSVGWCAVNSINGMLYTSDGDINDDKGIFVYKIDLSALKRKSNSFLIFQHELYLKDSENHSISRSCMQGGCFDDKNNLILINGYKNKKGSDNIDGGISVYRIPTDNKSNICRRIAQSTQYGHFNFNFMNDYYEPEGITFWNLNNKKAPGIRGVLHAIRLNNNYSKKDGLFIHHFDMSESALYKVEVKTGSKSAAGTDANVYIRFNDSTSGWTDFVELETNNDDFENSNDDFFYITMNKNCRDITNIEVKHDNSGDRPGWYCSYINITNMETGKCFKFNVDKWFAKDEDDKKIQRIIDCTSTATSFEPITTV